MASLTYRRIIETNNVTIGEPESYTGSAVISLSETVANSATTQVNCAIDVSAVKALAIVCSVACTVKTNSAGSPDDTIVLLANKPYIWVLGDYNALLLDTDVVSFHVVVAGVVDGTFKVEGLQDATP